MSTYEDDDWDELPEDIQEAAKVLGYTKQIWDGDGEVPCEDEDWYVVQCDECMSRNRWQRSF